MFPRVVRQLLLPMHEALLGRSTFSIWRQLETQPNPDPEWVRKVQWEGLTKILTHAREHIPYWRDRLADIRPDADLSTVPVLTRAEIGRHREAMRWRAAPARC